MNESKAKRPFLNFRFFLWCAVCAIPITFLFREYLELRSYGQQTEVIQQQNQAISEQINHMENTKGKLQNKDSFLIEKDAREKLNFVKPGEIVYKLSTTTTANIPQK